MNKRVGQSFNRLNRTLNIFFPPFFLQRNIHQFYPVNLQYVGVSSRAQMFFFVGISNFASSFFFSFLISGNSFIYLIKIRKNKKNRKFIQNVCVV